MQLTIGALWMSRARTSNLPWNDCDLVSVVGLLQKVIKIPHHLLEWIRHEIERAVRMNHGVLLEFTKIFFRYPGIRQFVGARRECSQANRLRLTSPWA